MRIIGGLVIVWVLLTACTPVLRGRYTWGHEVRTIQLCDSRDVYWVRCEPSLADQLRVFVETHTHRPYTPVYIEFQGHLLDQQPDGFAADYDGIFRLEHISSMQVNIPHDCGPH